MDFACNKAVLNRGSADLTVDAILEAAARLVSAFTGEDDVLLRYSLPPISSFLELEPKKFGLATAILEDGATQRSRSCAITTHAELEFLHAHAQTDFSVDILENGQTASFSTTV